MKFFSHIKIVDQHLARYTFSVSHDSHSTFKITPIQTCPPSDEFHLPSFTIVLKDGEWLTPPASELGKMPPNLLNELLINLEKKISGVMA
ncbi:hypothetical protein [Segetibacter sp.]|uniref:hypothetical protein n=1 Tax=Segetibacter sp. TaxID=2231182 RepID=UPI0026070958|nr:hypothetical protein [Segetibacter sp.]MCW3078947.1 hypothetical protein [Segetibacter sp.]